MRELKFGIEIEFFGKKNIYVKDLLQSNGIIAGLPEDNPNNNAWILKHDCSVHCEGNEIVSPILYGDEGLQEVKKVLDLMKDYRCQVDYSCGIHVHHDVADFLASDILNLLNFFYNNQSVFDLLMTDQRLLRHDYCKIITAEDILDLQDCTTINGMISSIYTRYKALNIQSYIDHGTVEFRQHYGCLDSEIILNWIELTYRCVCYAKEHKVDVDIDRHNNIKNRLFQFRKDLNIFNTPLSRFMNKQMINLNKAV